MPLILSHIGPNIAAVEVKGQICNATRDNEKHPDKTQRAEGADWFSKRDTHDENRSRQKGHQTKQQVNSSRLHRDCGHIPGGTSSVPVAVAAAVGWWAGAFLFAGGCVFTCCNVRSEGKSARGYVYSGNSDYMAYPPQPVRPLQPQQLVLLPQAQAQPVLSRHPSAQAQPVLSRHPSARAQPVLSRHPSTIYSYQSSQPSRYPSVRSGVAYL
ncbi:uncharacterized protein LOC109530770 [Hippocampus comes]|uniref:uncharacterized protein LOC109530770 n=1 Tax=Hippocampus comes TaxID=109280 RepID=UPI00094EA74E|nr:PREDICTED: uncharacterized protein LOC109530770 [Hippocampus comes]